MDELMTYAIEIHKRSKTELNNRRREICDYLLGLGVDPDVILELSSIDTELAYRGIFGGIGLS